MIKIVINGQSISGEYTKTASDSVDYLRVYFSFSEEWSTLVKTAQFTQNGKTYNVLLEDGYCLVPSEISVGKVQISVFGQKAGEALRITTLPFEFTVQKSGFVADGETAVPPSPDLYSQLISKIQTAVDGIPEKLSDFENDAGYITESAIPEKLSEFENDAGYITESAIPEKISGFENDAGYITESAIPEKISGFENDEGYITESAIPKKVSEFENDKGYITESAVPKKVSELENDKGYITDDNSCYDTVINSQEEWDAMVATADWNGARNILLKASIRIQMGTTDKQGTLKIPLNVQSIDGNHNGIMVFNTDIEPVETYSSRVCLFNFAPLQLIRSKCSYIKSMHHCSLNVIQSSSIQYSANIVNCSASFSDDSTLEVCDTILLDTVSMSLIKNREHEVLVNCTNIIYEKTKLSEFNNDKEFVTQTYVDDLVGNIETTLDGILALQNSLIGGDI